MNYQGKKWYCKEVQLIRNDTVWWADEYIEKPTYAMTKKYREFLKEKAKKNAEEELSVLKSKLEYQYKTYGEVNEMDFQEYEYKLKAYMGQ